MRKQRNVCGKRMCVKIFGAEPIFEIEKCASLCEVKEA